MHPVVPEYNRDDGRTWAIHDDVYLNTLCKGNTPYVKKLKKGATLSVAHPQYKIAPKEMGPTNEPLFPCCDVSISWTENKLTVHETFWFLHTRQVSQDARHWERQTRHKSLLHWTEFILKELESIFRYERAAKNLFVRRKNSPEFLTLRVTFLAFSLFTRKMRKNWELH
jgi:hypothetical protein